MKKKGHTLVPRNPFALAARKRHAGAHDKTHKIKRRDDRQVLRKLLRTGKEEDGSTSFFLTEKPSPSREGKPLSASSTPLLERDRVGMGLLCPYMDAGGGICSFQFCGNTSVAKISILHQ